MYINTLTNHSCKFCRMCWVIKLISIQECRGLVENVSDKDAMTEILEKVHQTTVDRSGLPVFLL